MQTGATPVFWKGWIMGFGMALFVIYTILKDTPITGWGRFALGTIGLVMWSSVVLTNLSRNRPKPEKPGDLAEPGGA